MVRCACPYRLANDPAAEPREPDGRASVPAAGYAASRLSLRDQFSDGGNEFSWDLHDRVSGGVVPLFVLGHSLLIGLVLVVIKDALNALLVPAWRESIRRHRLLSLRRRAFFALGPSS